MGRKEREKEEEGRGIRDKKGRGRRKKEKSVGEKKRRNRKWGRKVKWREKGATSFSLSAWGSRLLSQPSVA